MRLTRAEYEALVAKGAAMQDKATRKFHESLSKKGKEVAGLIVELPRKGMTPQEFEKMTLSLDARPSTDEEKLNKTEKRRLAILRAGMRRAIGIQDITLKLADDCRFTPDFNYIDIQGRQVFEDVKGFQREDALLKIKFAARKYPHFRFLIVKHSKRGWEEKEVKP